jgi:hypothetical protein
MVGGPKPEHPLHPHRVPLSRRQLLMQVAVAAVILGSGVGIGTGGTILALKGRIVPRVRWMPTDPPGPEPNFIVARWKTDYTLSDKQAQQVKELLIRQFTALRDLRQKLFAAEQTEREKFAAAIKKPLTPEQYAKWDQDMKERAQQFERMRASRGPRGDHKGPPHGDRGSGPRMGRGDWPSRGLMDPNNRRRGDRPPDQPVELKDRLGDVNTPK